MDGFTIAPWPEDDGNPYQRLFYTALEPFGLHRQSGLIINDQHLRDRAAEIDAIHLHWPEYAWRVHGQRIDRQARLVVGVFRFLRLANRLGIATIWTAHNARPHEAHSFLDHAGYFAVARNADVILTHGETARREVIGRYRPACPVVSMPHGNFLNAYPRPRAAPDVRVELGLRTDLPLLACVGALRPYKGLELAIEAVKRVRTRVQLVIAGSAKDESYVGRLRQLAGDTGNIVINDRPLSPQEFADVIGASDVVLLPYRRITTSGVLHAAWSFGRGVVTTPLPYFEEFVRTRPAAGRISDGSSADAFAMAIDAYLSVDPSTRSMAASEAAATFTWDEAALRVAQPLQAAIEACRRRAAVQSR